jgi:hypothetical protein
MLLLDGQAVAIDAKQVSVSSLNLFPIGSG